MRYAALLGLFAALSTPLYAETITSLVSSEQVAITSNFAGTNITVFGSIERDAGTVSRASNYDIAIVVKGPPVDVVTRKKERILGIWINKGARIFLSVPSFYTLYSNREIDELASPKVLQENQIGPENIVFPTIASSTQTLENNQDFVRAYRRLKARDELLQTRTDAVEFLSPTLFKSTVTIPARVPVGEYTIEIYLFREEALLARDVQNFRVSKVGFEQLVYDVSQDKSLIFGLVVVVLALATGWLGNIVFRRE